MTIFDRKISNKEVISIGGVIEDYNVPIKSDLFPKITLEYYKVHGISLIVFNRVYFVFNRVNLEYCWIFP